MLIKFTVSNFRNFSKPITLDFREKRDYRYNSKCVKNGLISNMIIYGPNASGKSNLGFALFDIVSVLTDKHTEQFATSSANFINFDSELTRAKFEYVFKKENDIITYIYEKSAPNRLVYESLYINDESIYAYDFETKTKVIGRMDLLEAESLNFEYLEDNFSIIRYIANNKPQSDDSYIKFIMHYVSHMLWFRSLKENGYIGFTTGKHGLSEWIIENNLVKEFEKFLKRMAGININLDVIEIHQPEKAKLLVEKHRKGYLSFEASASTGTKALEVLFFWSRRFGEVSLLFMDEFDAFYHPELARNIVRYIIDLDNVQTVFTTHNSYLASNELMRPDCYFKLSNGNLRSFADSTERELREGHNLEKMLRNGEFDE